MTVNVELMEQVLDHIETNPEQWDQDHWSRESSCGTSHCFAGWAIVFGSNAKFLGTAHAVLPDKTRVSVPELAQQLLGIPDAYWIMCEHHMFDSKNTLDDLRRYVKAYRDGEDVNDPDFIATLDNQAGD